MTWFERIKACETPEEMATLLDGSDRSFCARNDCPDTETCGECIARWLGEAC